MAATSSGLAETLAMALREMEGALYSKPEVPIQQMGMEAPSRFSQAPHQAGVTVM
jgi:hypothetical protein